MKTEKQQALEWFNSKSSLEKTRLTDTNTELVGNVRRYESLTGREIELIWKKETQETKTFKVGDKVKILSCDNWETIIEKIENDKYYSRDNNGILYYCTAEEMELVSEYNETFNPEAHSSLITDFGKDDVIETIEEAANKIFEKDSLLYEELIDGSYSYSIGVDFLKRFAIKLAKSEASKNHWFKIFQEEQKTIKQLFEELDPLKRAELIQGYCNECGLNTGCYCKNDE